MRPFIVLVVVACATPLHAAVSLDLGVAETVMDHATDACQVEDIADLPVRAFVDSDGKVQLIAGHFELYRSIGNNVSSVSRDCAQYAYVSDFDADPFMFNDFEWLTATYTLDGQNIFALVHDEYHGWDHSNCSSATSFDCWWNTITSASSSNAGLSYTHAAAPGHAVVVPATNYDPDSVTGPYGYFAPSNLIERDGYYYNLYQAEAKDAQDWGVCVMRTQDLSEPTSWRTWDGADFTIAPRGDGTTGPSCPVIARANIGKMHGYVSWNTYFQRYLVVGEHNVGGIWGFYYALSDDLIHWDPAQRLFETHLWWTGSNNDLKRGYVATLQPGDPSRNFEITGRSPYLYYTTWRPNDGTYERDLVRQRVRFNKDGDAGRYAVLDLEMNEWRGGTTLDASFHGNDATREGTTQWSTDSASGARSMVFAGGRLSVPHDASLELAGDVTLEAFIRVDATHASLYGSIAAKDGGTGLRTYGLYVAPQNAAVPGALHFSSSMAGNYVGNLGTRSVDDGKWHHVAAAYDQTAGRVYYYVDGVLDSRPALSADPASGASTANVYVGTNFAGSIDSVRIYNYALSGNEIVEHARPSGNVEICNGLDDTGEGTADEGFECTGTALDIESCASGCGDRSRTCDPATCRYGDWTMCPACPDGGADGGSLDGGSTDDDGFIDGGDSGATRNGIPASGCGCRGRSTVHATLIIALALASSVGSRRRRRC